jgi:hypothetical protein
MSSTLNVYWLLTQYNEIKKTLEGLEAEVKDEAY